MNRETSSAGTAVITPNKARTLRRLMRQWFRAARQEVAAARESRDYARSITPRTNGDVASQNLAFEDSDAAMVRASNNRESAVEILRQLRAARVEKFSAWCPNVADEWRAK